MAASRAVKQAVLYLENWQARQLASIQKVNAHLTECGDRVGVRMLEPVLKGSDEWAEYLRNLKGALGIV